MPQEVGHMTHYFFRKGVPYNIERSDRQDVPMLCNGGHLRKGI